MNEASNDNLDYELEKKLIDDYFVEISTRLARFIKRSIWAGVILGVAVTVSLILYGIVLTNQSEISQDIQDQRYDSLVETCQNQNKRNIDVNVQIDNAVDEIPQGPMHDQAEKGAEQFRQILEAAVPYTDNCPAYARDIAPELKP